MTTGAWLLLIPFAVLLIFLFRAATMQVSPFPTIVVPSGDPLQAPQAIASYGCGSCHTVLGIIGADGKAGPSLNGLGDQMYIAGKIVNTPENLIYFIRFPQEVSPGIGMPDTGITDAAARDIAAYLYTLK